MESGKSKKFDLCSRSCDIGLSWRDLLKSMCLYACVGLKHRALDTPNLSGCCKCNHFICVLVIMGTCQIQTTDLKLYQSLISSLCIMFCLTGELAPPTAYLNAPNICLTVVDGNSFGWKLVWISACIGCRVPVWAGTWESWGLFQLTGTRPLELEPEDVEEVLLVTAITCGFPLRPAPVRWSPYLWPMIGVCRDK